MQQSALEARVMSDWVLHAGQEKLGQFNVLDDVLEKLQRSELDHVMDFENKMSSLLLTPSIILS